MAQIEETIKQCAEEETLKELSSALKNGFADLQAATNRYVYEMQSKFEAYKVQSVFQFHACKSDCLSVLASLIKGVLAYRYGSSSLVPFDENPILRLQ